MIIEDGRTHTSKERGLQQLGGWSEPMNRRNDGMKLNEVGDGAKRVETSRKKDRGRRKRPKESSFLTLIVLRRHPGGVTIKVKRPQRSRLAGWWRHQFQGNHSDLPMEPFEPHGLGSIAGVFQAIRLQRSHPFHQYNNLCGCVPH